MLHAIYRSQLRLETKSVVVTLADVLLLLVLVLFFTFAVDFYIVLFVAF
jgi:hypothetical protein